MQSQRAVLIQDQRQKLNPQMLQSIKLMTMPILELGERIQEELEANPALEIIEEKGPVSLDDPPQGDIEVESYFESSSDSGFRATAPAPDDDSKRKFLEGAVARTETLQDHLLWQLKLVPLKQGDYGVGETLVQNLDANGFHRESVESLFPAGAPARLEEVMAVIRGLDPVGCCVSNFRESLLVQCAADPYAPDGAVQTIGHDDGDSLLELVERGKIAELSRKLKLSEGETREVVDYIKSLNPFPGRQYSPEETRYVVPDLMIRQKDGEFVIILNDEEIPVLGINPLIAELSVSKKAKAARAGQPMARKEENEEGREDGTDDPDGDPDDVSLDEADGEYDRADREQREAGSDGQEHRPRGGSAAASKAEREASDYARHSLREARFFIQSIHLRNRTLLKVAQALVEFQRAFFVKGPKYLGPLTLRDIAQEIGVHETTVSRLANRKYVQTEWGIYELKYFFTNAISGSGSTGSPWSKEGVKQIIKEMIESEADVLSDQAIADQLAQRGIKLARRTVAKYRNELRMSTSFERNTKQA